MSRDVEVVFTKDKKGSFITGQKKFVKPGYAFNYLFPYGYAILNNSQNQAKIQSISKEAEKKSIELKKNAEGIHGIINGQSITFHAKSHDEGKLYGSISIHDLVSRINIDFETTLDKHDIKGFTPIKALGSYSVNIVLHHDVRSSFNIIVEKEENDTQKSSSTTSYSKKTSKESTVQTYADEAPSPEVDADEVSSQSSIDDTIF